MILGRSQGSAHLEELWLKMAVFQWPIRVAGMSKTTPKRFSMVIDSFGSLPIVSQGCRMKKNCLISYSERDSLLLVPSQRAQKAANKTVQLDEL